VRTRARHGLVTNDQRSRLRLPSSVATALHTAQCAAGRGSQL